MGMGHQDKEILLRVTAPHFVAGVVFTKASGHWEITNVAPILQWMRDRSPREIEKYITSKGWEYQWIK